MPTSLIPFKRTFFCTGAFLLLSTFSYSQLPQKVIPVAKSLASPSVSAHLLKLPVSTVSNKFVPIKSIYQFSQPAVPTYAPTPAQVIPPKLQPVTDSKANHAQELLGKILVNPADDFYGFFQQIVYAHQNSRSVAKKMTRNYFTEVYILLQNAAYITQQIGYDSLASYLKAHQGQMPTLSAEGKFNTDETSRGLLTFFASEEMEKVLTPLLERPQSKRTTTDNEWLTINVLSVMIPDQTRPVFYELLLEKRYNALLFVSLDPYMRRPLTKRIAKGVPTPDPQIQIPSAARRITEREKRLDMLNRRQQSLSSIIQHQQQQYAKAQLIYDILINEGQIQNAKDIQKTLDKSHHAYLHSQMQLKEVSAQIRQIQTEIEWLKKIK